MSSFLLQVHIYKDDIMCMIYFLTGNCHINWN
ncbi:ABC-three component system protein [Zunongwangia sp. SCSIO 43204]